MPPRAATRVARAVVQKKEVSCVRGSGGANARSKRIGLQRSREHEPRRHGELRAG